MKKEHLDWLRENEACDQSIIWVEENNVQSLQEAWTSCERGDWLLWLAAELNVDKRKLAMCGALCAHTVIQYMKDPRSRDAVRIVFLWGRGKATDEQLMAARDAARSVVYVTYEDTYWVIARATRSTRAAVTAQAAARAADDAFSAIRTATRTARTVESVAETWSDAKAAVKENQLRTAEIARKVLTEEVMDAIRAIR